MEGVSLHKLTYLLIECQTPLSLKSSPHLHPIATAPVPLLSALPWPTPPSEGKPQSSLQPPQPSAVCCITSDVLRHLLLCSLIFQPHWLPS